MRLTNDERIRRLLVHCYQRILEEGSLVEDLDLLDAMQDCITGDECDMYEWTITKEGKIRFK